jgi:hypothetical protein
MVSLLLVAPVTYAEEALPAGFLEFLGTMVESEGELLDPLSMVTATEQVLIDEAGNADETPEDEDNPSAREQAREEPDHD